MDDAVAADLITVSRIDAVPSILRIVCEMTGLRFAAVARVTDSSWTACAVRDEIAFGLAAGGQLDLETTICEEIRCSGDAVIIDNVAEDPHFRDHHTPKLYGFQSYISVPIHVADGSFFGTLCALDPSPARVSDAATVAVFKGFAQLIGLQLDAQDRLATAQATIAKGNSDAGLREQFIAILGHDLRNPVAAIQAGTTLLGKNEQDPRRRTILRRMTESVTRITGLIDGLLDFARGRLGAGLILKSGIATNLAASIEQVIAELQIVHPAREIDVYVALTEQVFCDNERISQLLSNLLANALAHGDATSPVVVTAKSGEGLFTLAVENKGKPIPAAAIEGLFQPFARGPDETPTSGLGLGLYICSEIAKAHGGTLAATSEGGRTCFTLKMPTAPAVP